MLTEFPLNNGGKKYVYFSMTVKKDCNGSSYFKGFDWWNYLFKANQLISEAAGV